MINADGIFPSCFFSLKTMGYINFASRTIYLFKKSYFGKTSS